MKRFYLIREVKPNSTYVKHTDNFSSVWEYCHLVKVEWFLHHQTRPFLLMEHHPMVILEIHLYRCQW